MYSRQFPLIWAVLLLLLFIAGTRPAYSQEYYRGSVQLFGNEEGAAMVHSSQWHVVTKTIYTRFLSMFPPPLAGTAREYYLVFRKADQINDCGEGPEFRFWFTYLGKAGHAFTVQRDWGNTNEGTAKWVKVPENWEQVEAIQQRDGQSFNFQQTYFRLEARIPASCPAHGMKIYSIHLVAVDKVGGVSASFAFNTDGPAPYTAVCAIGGLAGNLYIRDGNIGIGTDNPGVHKLAVEGILGARKVKVTQAGWADFVFRPGYALPSLQELEAYIAEHQHLPGIPSEKEVTENGLDLGEMDKKLLQKIEELTLYMMELNRQNQALKMEVTELKRQLQQTN